MTASVQDTPIVREHDDPHGRYVTNFANGLEAVLAYSDTDGVRTITTTTTPPELRGQGVAAALMKAAVADARDDGMKIHPQCSYAAAWFKRHPEHADLLATES